MGNLDQTATMNEYDPETGESLQKQEVSVWAIEPDEHFGAQDTGLCVALPGSTDLVITEETLAALGYVKA